MTEMKAVDFLYEKYRDLFDAVQKAIENRLDFLVGQNLNTLKKQVTLFHFARAGYLLDAIYQLTLQGFATEAMVILRSLLNLYINIKWITNRDTENRFERFADFGVVGKRLGKDAVIKDGGIWDEIKNDNLNVQDEDFQAVKKKYNLKKVEDFFNWSGMSTYKMASEDDVNLEKDYRIIYGRLSSIEHTGPESVRDYLDDSQNGITRIKTGPRDENVDLVLLTALDYYNNVKAITHNIFGLEWPTLESDRETFLNIRKTYWGNNERKV